MKMKMKRIVKLLAVVLMLLGGYMMATDAIGRWFGLVRYTYVFNIGYICALPALVALTGYPERAAKDEK